MDDIILRRTVRTFPEAGTTVENVAGNSIFLNLMSAIDTIIPWGEDWRRRDNQLRGFWKKEPFLASAIFSVVATRSSFSWELDGPPRTVGIVHSMLQQSEFGKGFMELKKKVALDLLTQDNGAFVEIIRNKPPRGSSTPPEAMPARALAHLDSGRCIRTGNPKEPVLYVDSEGKVHRLKWYQVITFEEMPSPDEDHKGRQISFLSRVLAAARIINEINTYQQEKISGRFTRAIHLVGGVSQQAVENIQDKSQLDADNRGLTRYMPPIIMATLDPNARVSKETIELASMPEHFNFDETMKWYISLLAMAAGGDYQDLAPLPGGNLGTDSQSETLHQKSRIKGHNLWMKLWEHKMQHHRVIPSTVTFRYKQLDTTAEMEHAELSHKRAITRKARIESNEISLEVARQIAVDDGDLDPRYLMMMGEADETPAVVVGDEDLPPDPSLFESAPGSGDNQTFVNRPLRQGDQIIGIPSRDDSDQNAPNNAGSATSGGRPPKNEEEAKLWRKWKKKQESQRARALRKEIGGDLSGERVGTKTAYRAAAWIRKILEEHPVQYISPIPQAKLNTFTQWLRNNITNEMTLGTTETWQDALLTKAAYESGIHPHVLRHRLPDNYFLVIEKGRVADNRGNLIYRKPVDRVTKSINPARVASGDACYVCGRSHHRYAYIPFRGWKSVCESHKGGFLGNKDLTQVGMNELIEGFKEQYIEYAEKGDKNGQHALLLSTLLYAYQLGTGLAKLKMTKSRYEKLTEEFANQKTLMEVTDDPGVFVMGIEAIYLDGTRRTWNA